MMTYTEQDKQDIIDAYNNDEKLTEVGRRYGVSGDVISYYIMQWGVPKRDNRKYKFTDDDYKFLEKEYPIGNWDAIFERFPNVPRNKIYRIMSDRKISQDAYHWTEHDKDILRQYYGELTAQEIQPMLDDSYSVKAIQTQAIKLGLTESREWTDNEISILKHNYSLVSRDELHKLLPRKSDDAISIKARQLHLISLWKIEHLYTDAEDKIIFDNWEEMSDAEIGKLIGRDALSVKVRRNNLGLKREYGKSGYETLAMYIRKNINEWKQKSAKSCGYRCALTGRSFDEIHHKHGFRLIFDEALSNIKIEDKGSIDDYTDEELQCMLNEFTRIQSLYPLGVCLCKEVHKLYHHIYGYGNNTVDQWNEFEQDFKNGKYVDIIK